MMVHPDRFATTIFFVRLYDALMDAIANFRYYRLKMFHVRPQLGIRTTIKIIKI
jgi:hypothetical protein